MDDNFLKVQRNYWNTLAAAVKDDVAVTHCVDENSRAVGEELFREIALFLKEEFLQGTHELSLLEIGCGNGLVLKHIADLCDDRLEMCGCDISEEMLSRMLLGRVRTYCSDARKIPCEDGKFDLVYMHSVVQYFDNLEYLRDVMAECLRITKPGGAVCLLDVPCKWYQDYMTRNDFKARVKRRVAGFAEKHCKALISYYRRRRQVATETINGVSISVPSFRGLYVDPDFFYGYGRDFEHVSVEVQPFKHKPQIYRKFRFNIVMKDKRALAADA